MHIGFIEDTHLHGGTQIWVSEAVRAFIEAGHKVTLLAPEGSWVVDQSRGTGALIATYNFDDVVKEDKQNINIWHNALEDCDIAMCTVHPPRAGFHPSVFAARVIRKGNLKTHLIPKTGTIVPDYQREFYLPDENIRSSVVAIADFTRSYLIETYKIPEELVRLIYLGTDVHRFRSSESARREAEKRYPLATQSAPIVGSIGSLEPRKGHLVLFDAIKELTSSSLPTLHLMLVGDGPDEEMLKEKVKNMALSEHISFFPFTDQPNYVFERLDITVLPSLYKEGLPNVLLESLAMGVPAIASDIGGVAEVVLRGETGYLVEPGDSAELANALNEIWADQEKYTEMRSNARRLITERFNKENQFNKFLSYFHEVNFDD